MYMRQLTNVRNDEVGLGSDHDRPAPAGTSSQPHGLEGIPGERGVAMPKAAGYDRAMHRVDPTDFEFGKEFGRLHHPVGYRERPEGEDHVNLTCRCYRSWVVIELGWIHAGLAIVAVIGGSVGSIQILGAASSVAPTDPPSGSARTTWRPRTLPCRGVCSPGPGHPIAFYVQDQHYPLECVGIFFRLVGVDEFLNGRLFLVYGRHGDA